MKLRCTCWSSCCCVQQEHHHLNLFYTMYNDSYKFQYQMKKAAGYRWFVWFTFDTWYVRMCHMMSYVIYFCQCGKCFNVATIKSARVGKIGQTQQIWHMYSIIVYQCISLCILQGPFSQEAMDCIHCLGLWALPRSRAKWSPLKARRNSGVSTWHCKASGSVKTWKQNL